MAKDNKWMHETYLYPVVRIFSQKAAGSGTIIYSKEDPKEAGEYMTFVLTNHHVIADLITQKRDWDSLAGRKIEKEFRELAKVEYFSYVRDSSVDSSNRFDAEIVAHDENHDLALLKIQSPRKFKHTATLLPEDKIKSLRLYMDIVVSGCSLAHEPFSNFGQITFLKELIDQKEYFMVNAASIFGNSGGALFLKDSGEFIGVPSRITNIQLGFGYDVMTWMGFSAHTKRLYEFFKEQEMKFIFDDTDNFYDALIRRENRKKEAILTMKAEIVEQTGLELSKD
jgi:S1-C subfamily serine protease